MSSCPDCGDPNCQGGCQDQDEEEMPEIEIEELWQPNEEEKENLAKKIDWRTTIRELNKLAEKDSKAAFDALINLKDLVGSDRFADIMVEFAPYGSCDLYEKVAKHGIKRV